MICIHLIIIKFILLNLSFFIELSELEAYMEKEKSACKVSKK